MFQVEAYKDTIKAKAEERVLKGFPETIMHMNDVLETTQFKNKDSIDVRQELNIPVPDPIIFNSHTELPPAKKTKFDNSISQDGTKVMALPTGPVLCNKYLMDMIEVVKPHIRKLIEDSNLVSRFFLRMVNF